MNRYHWSYTFIFMIKYFRRNDRIASKSKDRILQQIAHSQSKDGILSAKWSFTLSFKIVYFQPYDPMFPISKDSFKFPFLICNRLFFVYNLIFMFPIYFHVYNLHCFQCMFPIYIFSHGVAMVIFELPIVPRRHFNPYWQIMENSSVTQAVLLKNSSNFFEISILGRHTDRFTGKLIHSNFLTETIYDI